MLTRLWTAVMVVLLAITFCKAGEAGDQFDDVRRQIEQTLVDNQVPSIAVAVSKDGQIVWEQGFGWADRANRVRASEHTMYSLASISKPITATALMILVERGLADLDKAANHYLGEAKLSARTGDADEATLRRLANHTAGLPLHYQFFYVDESFRPPHRDESIRRYGQLHAAPGERYQYANFGYGVLDYVIERLGEKSFSDFMRQELFLPLGLTHTSVHLPRELTRHQAIRYAADQSPLPFYFFDHDGASAVYSSAHDLVRFGMFHLNQTAPDQKQVLTSESIEEMQKPTAHIGGKRHYGVGWFIDENENGVRTVSHSGGMGGVRTRLTLVPDHGLVVAALCNSRTQLPMRVTQKIMAIMIPETQAALQNKRQEPAEDSQPEASVPESMLGHWLGSVHTYQGKKAIQLWLKPSGDIHLEMDGQLKMLLNETRFENGELWGVFLSDIGTEDANRRPYRLRLRAKLRGESLSGTITALTLPSARAGNALSYWFEARQKTDRKLFNGRDLSNWRIISKNDFDAHGDVGVEDNMLLLGTGSPATGVSYTAEFPKENYEVTLQAKRTAGGDFFCGMTFPVQDSHCTLIVGGWGGGVIGLSNIDDLSAIDNETTNYINFKDDRWYKIRLRVTSNRIETWIDDEQVIDVEIKNRKLSIWWEQEPVRPFGIATWNTAAAIRDVQLKRLDK